MLGYSPDWAATEPDPVWHSGSPPLDISQYASFARGLASRYGPGGSFSTQNPQVPYDPVHMYEIWNEEDSYRYWNTGPNPAQYAQMYLQARAAIRSEDPNAIVIVGGLTDGNGEADAFARQMFAADPALRGNVDGFGLHPYVVTPNDFESRVATFRQTLDSLGAASVPIDITELGWATRGPSTSPAAPRSSRISRPRLATPTAESGCSPRMTGWIRRRSRPTPTSGSPTRADSGPPGPPGSSACTPPRRFPQPTCASRPPQLAPLRRPRHHLHLAPHPRPRDRTRRRSAHRSPSNFHEPRSRSTRSSPAAATSTRSGPYGPGV